MVTDISDELRRLVAERAGHRCEYCLLHEDDSYSPHQIDHIIGRKHGGPSTLENLAYACLRCNAWKGSDIGSVDPETGQLVSLFNPRRQEWAQHFRPLGFVIEPLTAEGRATVQLLIEYRQTCRRETGSDACQSLSACVRTGRAGEAWPVWRQMAEFSFRNLYAPKFKPNLVRF